MKRWQVGLIFGVVACLSLARGIVAQVSSWAAVGPFPRVYSATVYDPSSSRMIVFGGAAVIGGPGNLNDVWRLTSGLKWAPATPVKTSGTPPSPRRGHGLFYDPASNRMIVFGGALGNSSPCTNDVWLLTNANGKEAGLPTWIELDVFGTAPAPRLIFASGYNPTTNTLIVYGGNNCFSTNYGDAWVLSHASGLGGTPTWTQLSPSGPSPSSRGAVASVYVPNTNRLIMFGGNGPTGLLNDVWVLSNADGTTGTPAWNQLSISGPAPSPRAHGTAVYDPAHNRMTVFGGWNTVPGLDEAWVLVNANGIGTPSWTNLALPVRPQARHAQTAVYDAKRNRMIIFSGTNNAANMNDVWVLKHSNGL